jgi:hypothetical protein
MSVLNRVLLAVGAGTVIAFSAVVLAQAQTKSVPATTIEEGDAIMISPKGSVHKSDSKVTSDKHVAAVSKGAREITKGTVIYNQGGKFYMLQDQANERASQSFQDHFDVDY